MKTILKLTAIVVFISLLTSCSNENEIEENITKGYWIENLTKEKFINGINENQDLFKEKENISKEASSFISNLPEKIEHYLVFENDRFKEYITLRKDKLVLIVDFPSSISKNILTLYHPDNSGKIISTIEILNGMVLGHDTSNAFGF